MPNHILNKLTFEGDPVEIAKLMNFVKTSDEQLFDFNQLIPMPTDLNVESGSITTDSSIAYLRIVNPANVNTVHPKYPKMGQKEFTDLVSDITSAYRGLCMTRDNTPEIDDDTVPVDPNDADSNALLEKGQRYVTNYIKYGAITWYEWCISHWDTKWNAYDCHSGDDWVEFNSAWSPPMPVIEALADKFPDIKITHVWACEFCGDSGGKTEYYNNNAKVLLDGSIKEKDAFDAYFEAYGTTPEDAGLVYNPFTEMYCPISPCSGYEDASDMPTLPTPVRTITCAYLKANGNDVIPISMAIPGTYDFTSKNNIERNASLWTLRWTK